MFHAYHVYVTSLTATYVLKTSTSTLWGKNNKAVGQSKKSNGIGNSVGNYLGDHMYRADEAAYLDQLTEWQRCIIERIGKVGLGVFLSMFSVCAK